MAQSSLSTCREGDLPAGEGESEKLFLSAYYHFYNLTFDNFFIMMKRVPRIRDELHELPLKINNISE